MLQFKINQEGYVLLNGKIEKYNYKQFLREFGGDETTTFKGIAPRLYIEGNTIMSHGEKGQRIHVHSCFSTKKEAKNSLYEIWEGNIYGREFFQTKKDMYAYLAEIHQKDVAVIKRYFRIEKFYFEKAKLSKIKHDNRPSFTKEMMLEFINSNREMINESLAELDQLKSEEKKDVWQVKANALIQKVSNNDFRLLKWKEIYDLIKLHVKCDE